MIRPDTDTRFRSLLRRRPRAALLAGSLALLLLIITLSQTVSGAWALFAGRDSLTTTLSAGSVVLTWDDDRANQFGSTVGPLMPNQSIERVADLTNTGSLPLSAAQLGFAGDGTGSTSDGVQVAIDRCSDAWVREATVFRCAATTTILTEQRPSTGLLSLTGSPVFRAGQVDHLRFTFTLPASSPPADSGTTGTVIVTATGVVEGVRQR